MNRALLFCIALATAIGCRKPSTDCVLALSVQDAGVDVESPPVPGIGVEFKQQILAGGVLTSAFVSVDEGETDANGACTLEFKKENALIYRLDLQAEGWFSRQIEWNPDEFLPGQTVEFTTDMMPRATLRIRLEAGLLTGPDDVLQFRTLHVPGEYPTCSNAWRTFDANTGADTTWVCDMEGGANVAYAWTVTRDGETESHVDSLVAERFEETMLHLVW
jgi:hypothetical protein